MLNTFTKKISLIVLCAALVPANIKAEMSQETYQLAVYSAKWAVGTVCSLLIIKSINTHIIQPLLPKIDELNSNIKEHTAQVHELKEQIEPEEILAKLKAMYNPNSDASNGQELQAEVISALIDDVFKPENIEKLAHAYDPELEVQHLKGLIERVIKDFVTKKFYEEKVKPLLEFAIEDANKQILKKIESAKDKSKEMALKPFEKVWGKISDFTGIGQN